MKSEIIAGFFKTREQGEAAVQTLTDSGFTKDEVSFVCGTRGSEPAPRIGTIESTGAESEAEQDAWIGGVVGLAAGMVALVIPGIGPALAVGPIAGAIAGLGAGAATGGVIGLLRDHGVSEEEAEFYAKGVSHGGALVTVHDVSSDRASEARTILKRQGAMETEDLNA